MRENGDGNHWLKLELALRLCQGMTIQKHHNPKCLRPEPHFSYYFILDLALHDEPLRGLRHYKDPEDEEDGGECHRCQA